MQEELLAAEEEMRERRRLARIEVRVWDGETGEGGEKGKRRKTKSGGG